jgi:hypothetical protein
VGLLPITCIDASNTTEYKGGKIVIVKVCNDIGKNGNWKRNGTGKFEIINILRTSLLLYGPKAYLKIYKPLTADNSA